MVPPWATTARSASCKPFWLWVWRRISTSATRQKSAPPQYVRPQVWVRSRPASPVSGKPCHISRTMSPQTCSGFSHPIFARAIALNAIFAEAPDPYLLSMDFTRNYYRFADNIYRMLMQDGYKQVEPADLQFDLYASGEYSRMLEREWGEAEL